MQARDSLIGQAFSGNEQMLLADIKHTPESPHTSSDESQSAELEAIDVYKHAIYSHPLFPLLALLFDKCEDATYSPDHASSDAFDGDIQTFIQQDGRSSSFFSQDAELDNLMVKAIQVLRIHLLEMEKVNELCKDFCSRYITCLRGKLHSDNLLRGENDPPMSPTDDYPLVQPAVVSQGQIVSGGTVYQMVQTPQGIVAQPISFQNPASQTSVGHVSLSQLSPNSALHNSLGMSSEEDEYGEKRKLKRGILPKQATQVMKSWLFQHIVHPYPTEDEKRQIAAQTNLSLLQVNNWFINARRRILQPMLDASNPESSKNKKTKPQTRPAQRFWPEKLATLQAEESADTYLAAGLLGDNSASEESLHSLE